jgi:hypothetical protein
MDRLRLLIPRPSRRRDLFSRLLAVAWLGAFTGLLSGAVAVPLVLVLRGSQGLNAGTLVGGVALQPVVFVYWWAIGLGFARSVGWVRSQRPPRWASGLTGAALGAVLWGGGAVVFFEGLEASRRWVGSG